ncbi:hypothetical protein [Sphingomonas sp. MMS24-J13]|uniref:hypothetical protein n=1 Tax=Sphingomonas sp. MMS24-J13 TaxID=3238686 RepID=UPI00384A7B35
MDFTKFAAKETAFIHFKGPDGAYMYDDGKKVGVTVYGPSSKQYAIVDDRGSARALKRMQDNDNKISPIPGDERREQQAQDLAELTVSFENITYPPAGDAQGSTLFAAFYADPAMGFFKDQVAAGVNKWGNFMPASAGN